MLDYTPRDAARPASVITITFDRPVVGTPDHTAEWRDPSTVRIIPLEPLIPGTRYDIIVDTAFTAIDGSALAAPEHIAVAVRGRELYAARFLPDVAVRAAADRLSAVLGTAANMTEVTERA